MTSTRRPRHAVATCAIYAGRIARALAAAASRHARRDAAIAKAVAANDLTGLAKLGRDHAAARAALAAIVGPERFPAYRPAGYSRSCWTISP